MSVCLICKNIAKHPDDGSDYCFMTKCGTPPFDRRLDMPFPHMESCKGWEWNPLLSKLDFEGWLIDNSARHADRLSIKSTLITSPRDGAQTTDA